MPGSPKHLRWLVLGPLALQVLACTITSDAFKPTEIDSLLPDAATSSPVAPLPPVVSEPSEPVAAEPVPVTLSDAGGISCNTELPSCPMLQPVPQPEPAAPECLADGDCASLHCQNGDCIAASCDDGIANQGESAADCGGPCTARCAEGQACTGTADCASGFFCPEQRRQCTQVSCGDGVRNGDETATDCGGSCAPCAVGAACAANPDCVTGVCRGGACAAASCNDGVLNQNESAADCGGGCAACVPGRACRSAADCDSRVCDGRGCAAGLARCCQPARCNDGVRNGNEPQTDCGNAQCGGCALGSPCNRNAECGSGLCQTGVCRQPLCQDRQRNGSETDVDCGGTDPACARCASGQACLVNTDCSAGSCVNGRCADCGNGVRDGTETGTDCGGACGACAAGQGCNLDSDCQSNACQDGRCCGGNQVDCTRCARRLAAVISCNIGAADAAPVCSAFLQCLQDNPGACPTRHAAGCSDAGGACDTVNFGGSGSAGVMLGDNIIGTAGCLF
jgi:hypothetical protein